jgi:hypothetical protein
LPKTTKTHVRSNGQKSQAQFSQRSKEGTKC